MHTTISRSVVRDGPWIHLATSGGVEEHVEALMLRGRTIVHTTHLGSANPLSHTDGTSLFDEPVVRLPSSI
jgi:hypothetical protein